MHETFNDAPLPRSGSGSTERTFRFDAHQAGSDSMTVTQAPTKPLIAGIGGSARPQASGELTLKYCVGIAGRAEARTELIIAEDLQLPMYDPTPAPPSRLVRRRDGATMTRAHTTMHSHDLLQIIYSQAHINQEEAL